MPVTSIESQLRRLCVNLGYEVLNIQPTPTTPALNPFIDDWKEKSCEEKLETSI